MPDDAGAPGDETGAELARMLEARAEKDLEWRLLLGRVAGYARGAVAVGRIERMLPATTVTESRSRMARASSALALLVRDDPLPNRDVFDLEPILRRLEISASVSSLELARVMVVLDFARNLRRYANDRRDAHPELALALASEPRLDALLSTLARAIEADGEVKDSADDGLRSARARARNLRHELLSRMDSLARRHGEVLREAQYLEYEGRYALPVRADAHYPVQGIVLGSSASGATLYVEPQEVTPLANRLRVAESDAERELARVVAELASRVGAELEAVIRAYEAAVEANVLGAIARYAVATDAVPVFVDEEPTIELRAVRHPLLALGRGEVVPNDIRLDAGSALVISGPNAGGKTVVLKCLGLACWMARAGLPLPAAEASRIGFFDPVLTDIGDDQSLLQSLSTFSGHIRNLGLILDHAKRGALVLLDEVAAGTDPEEGSALAVAVLEALVARGAAVAVTTHYEKLKELAASEPRLENASVGFDFEHMAPTFRLRMGVPGPSSALAVALRHGLPQEIVARAKELVSVTSIDREAAVRKLEQEQAQLEAVRRRVEVEAQRQSALREEEEREQRRERDRERERLAAETRELMVLLRGARARLLAAEHQLKKEDVSAASLRRIANEVDAAARHVAIGSPLAGLVRPAQPAGPPASEEQLRPGTRVRLRKLGTVAEVIDVPQHGEVRVLAGSMKLVVRVDEVEVPKQRGTTSSQRDTKRKATQSSFVSVPVNPARTSGNTIDLRGQRVDDALEMVDVFIDKMMAEGEPAGFVLHGHGTGALKAAVRGHLRKNRFVERANAAEPDDGGDAFTLFRLKA